MSEVKKSDDAAAKSAEVKKFTPEVVLKRKRKKKRKIKRDKHGVPLNYNKHKKERLEIYCRAEKYAKEYAQQSKDLIRSLRNARNNNQYFIPAEAKVMFVIRIRGILCMHPNTKKVLQLFRLRQVHNGVFIKINKATINMLKKIIPYITYGTPSRKSISDLIYKRGFGKIKGQRIPLTHNKIIKEALGKFNIICIADVIHEIVTCGPFFKQVNNFLWPFKLSSPRGGFRYIKTNFSEGGDAGNREEYINKLIQSMN